MLVLGHVGAAGREGWIFHLEKLGEIGPLPLGGVMLVIASVGFNKYYKILEDSFLEKIAYFRF